MKPQADSGLTRLKENAQTALQRRAVFCRILLSSWQPIKLRLAACFRREASPLGLGQPRGGAISQSAFASRLGFRRAASPLGLEGAPKENAQNPADHSGVF